MVNTPGVKHIEPLLHKCGWLPQSGLQKADVVSILPDSMWSLNSNVVNQREMGPVVYSGM